MSGEANGSGIPPKKKIDKKKGKKSSEEFGGRKRSKKELSLEMQNKLMAKEIVRLEDKIERLKKKHPKREKKPPTAKQLKQWAEFSGKVQKAKEIYHAQEERSSEAWSRAMKQANATVDGDMVELLDNASVDAMEEK